MNKITQNGKVIITEGEIVITQFVVEDDESGDFRASESGLQFLERGALEWAAKRIGDELYAIKYRKPKTILRRLAEWTYAFDRS